MNRLRKLWMDKVAPYMIFSLAAGLGFTGMMMASGCSISFLGRVQNVYQYRSDSGQADPVMEAPSNIKDSINPTIPISPEEGASLPPVVTNPVPPDPEPIPPVVDPVGDNTFLWKPVSETTGKLVVLTPAELHVISTIAPGGEQSDTPGNRANGNRQHFRFSLPGSGYPPGQFVAIDSLGMQHAWTISNPSQRTEI